MLRLSWYCVVDLPARTRHALGELAALYSFGVQAHGGVHESAEEAAARYFHITVKYHGRYRRKCNVGQDRDHDRNPIPDKKQLNPISNEIMDNVGRVRN